MPSTKKVPRRDGGGGHDSATALEAIASLNTDLEIARRQLHAILNGRSFDLYGSLQIIHSALKRATENTAALIGPEETREVRRSLKEWRNGTDVNRVDPRR